MNRVKKAARNRYYRYALASGEIQIPKVLVNGQPIRDRRGADLVNVIVANSATQESRYDKLCRLWYPWRFV